MLSFSFGSAVEHYISSIAVSVSSGYFIRQGYRMMKKLILVGVTLSLASFQAMADTPSFSFVEGGYVSNLGGSFDFDGFEIKGTMEISDNLYMSGSYTKTNIDSPLFDLDIDLVALGLGYKTDISDVSTLFAEADYVKFDSSFNGFGAQDGYRLAAGIRSNVLGDVELKAVGYYQDVRGSDSFLQVGAAYNFSESAAAYLNIDSDFDDSSFSLGVRFYFQ